MDLVTVKFPQLQCHAPPGNTKWQDASTTFWFHPQNKTAIGVPKAVVSNAYRFFFAINFSAAESAISLIKSPLRLNIKAPLIFRLSHVNAPVFSLNCIAEGACKLQVDHLPNHFGAAEIIKATEAVLGSEYSNQVHQLTASTSKACWTIPGQMTAKDRHHSASEALWHRPWPRIRQRPGCSVGVYDALKHMDMRMASFHVAVIKNESSGVRGIRLQWLDD